jgi:hypothetical protein
LYHPYLSAGKRFDSLLEFFLEMEKLLDAMGFPQSFLAVRSFADQPERVTQPLPEAEVQEGQCGPFSVGVLFRQSASWQGAVTWLEDVFHSDAGNLPEFAPAGKL